MGGEDPQDSLLQSACGPPVRERDGAAKYQLRPTSSESNTPVASDERFGRASPIGAGLAMRTAPPRSVEEAADLTSQIKSRALP
ncbi:hypothetical protein GCM10010458_27030 [Microbacterium luteolum]